MKDQTPPPMAPLHEIKNASQTVVILTAAKYRKLRFQSLDKIPSSVVCREKRNMSRETKETYGAPIIGNQW